MAALKKFKTREIFSLNCC